MPSQNICATLFIQITQTGRRQSNFLRKTRKLFSPLVINACHAIQQSAAGHVVVKPGASRAAAALISL